MMKVCLQHQENGEWLLARSALRLTVGIRRLWNGFVGWNASCRKWARVATAATALRVANQAEINRCHRWQVGPAHWCDKPDIPGFSDFLNFQNLRSIYIIVTL